MKRILLLGVLVCCLGVLSGCYHTEGTPEHPDSLAPISPAGAILASGTAAR
ncbi:MAG TPA: hypothetical protein VMD30_05035 [Tepidisphaeraceae bacterium]|nr:hypothetical protein [Tepidisphaeraceae bacterium]